jgi:uncharacterized protein YjbI with pentapeptide repeats
MEKYQHKYGAEQIQVLEGLEAVRKRPGMYIGSTSVRGLHHMVYEIVDNGVDEALAGYCTEINVIIEKGNIITVIDNGRGIPVEIHPKTHISTAETVYTVLHAGGKFGGDSGYKVSGGLHGVGASVVNALSSWTEVTIQRDGGIFEMKFEKGKTTEKLKKIGESKKTGTKVRFLADDTIWTYNYSGYNYQKIKNTLFNTLLLIRVYQKGALIEKNSTKTTFWSSDGEFIQILNSNIFADWCDMFKQKVIISNNNIISIGQNCLLDGLNFENRSMQNVGFQDSSLRKASFNNTNLNGIDFAYSDLSNAFFSGAILEKINFSNALLDDIDFSNATLINCNFTGAKIRRGKFDLTKVVDCAFKDLKVEDVNWGTTKIQRCHLENVKFTNSCLDRIKLRKETINNSEFINCSLKKADLERCNVQESIFGECVLDEIILIGAELCNIEITKTSCRNANLSNSSIEDSQLISIDFENTSFTQAILKKNSWEHMKFRNSDFRHTQIFTDDFIKLKKYDADLRWSVEKNEDF